MTSRVYSLASLIRAGYTGEEANLILVLLQRGLTAREAIAYIHGQRAGHPQEGSP